MKISQELENLSKRDLIRILISEREYFKQKIDELERRLLVYENAHTPSSKQLKKNTKKKEETNDKPRFPGKPKGSNGGGINIPEPDEIIEHTLDKDPISGKPLGKPIGYYKKIVIDFPDKPIKVIEHRIMKYISPATGEIVYDDVGLPSNIYGRNLQSIVAMLKNLTNSHKKIADFIRYLGAASFSDAEVQNIADSFADRLEPKRDGFLEELRKAPFVHSDETGFRRDGKNGYVWGVFTNTISILSAGMSRARCNIEKLLKNFKNVLVVDGYNAYDCFPIKQRCWVHLLRDFKNASKDNAEIEVQYKRLSLLYEKLKLLNEKPPDEDEIRKAKGMLKDIVACLKAIRGARSLVTLVENGKDDWFTALYYEGVPLDNNLAERELRPIVLLRKTIGCYRNEKGKRWIDIVVSVLHTWKLRGMNLFQNLRAIVG